MIRKILLHLFLLISILVKAQCPNNNTLWLTTTPGCPGTTTATTCIYGGEYQIINVVAGNTYTFNTCINTTWDTEITIYSTIGGNLIGYNDDACGLQSIVTWIATFTGQINVLVDAFPCSNLNSCATLTIICSSPGPAVPEDCLGSITICNDQAFTNNTNNTGNIADLNLFTAGCLGALERQGTWYNFTIASSGQLGFDINPLDPLDDYDFAIWGPFPQGSSLGNICSLNSIPFRCSFSALGGTTGLDYSSIDLTEGVGGDKWVRYMDVIIGQVYLLYISNFSQSGLAFSLDWNLQNGASLNCVVLPVELVSFEGYPQENDVMLEWVTTSEQNVSHFEIQRSFNGTEFHTIGTHAPMGSVASTTLYSFLDDNPAIGTNYYRIRTFDHNNPIPTLTHVISVEFEKFISTLNVQPNPTNGFVQIIMRAVDEKIITIKVYDARGRMLEKHLQPIQKGDNTITIDITNHPSGYYHLTMNENENESVVAQGKFVKY